MKRLTLTLAIGLGLLAGCDDPDVREAGDAIGDAAVKTGEAADDVIAEGASATGRAMEDAGRNLQEASGDAER